MAKIVTASEAIQNIKDGASVGVGGFATFGGPDALLREIRRSYDATRSPRSLHIVAPACPGDGKIDGYGMSAIADEGIISTVITSHIGQVPNLIKLVGENKIGAVFLPLGVFSQIYRSMTAGRPFYTHIGLNTFVDPRVEGGRVNEKADEITQTIVSLKEIDGKEHMRYHDLPVDVCLLRGSIADEDGNISFEREAIPAEQMEMASAIHRLGGTVIVQVEKIVPRHSIKPRNVWIHNRLVDYVVVAGEGEHPHTYEVPAYRPELMGEFRVPVDAVEPMEMGVRKIIARRGAMELFPNALVNLGLGISDGVSIVASEEGLSDQINLTIETGIFGGVPLAGLSMGAGVNSDAVYRTADTFDLYDGGILDMAYLSGAQIDRNGNVNVSKFGGRCTGPGGFINISQNARKMCFLGTFTAGKQDIGYEDGKLLIRQDGDKIKYKAQVEQITYSGTYARQSGQEVFFISERAVFQLTADGLELVEIAPGVDLERDVLGKMEFTPLISPNLKTMDERIFCPEKMGLTFQEAASCN